MHTFALIGARSGSVGVRGKNIRKLAGHPLLAFSIKAAHKAGIENVIVSTDTEEYAQVALHYGAKVPFLRPAEISGPESTDYEYVRHAIDILHGERYGFPDLIVLLRPTSPLRNYRVIQMVVDLMKYDENHTGLRSVHEMSESAYKCFQMTDDQQLLTALRGSPAVDVVNDARQTFTKTYSGNGYVDVVRSSYVVNPYCGLYGSRVRGFVTEPIEEVDTEEDWAYLEYQASKKMALVSELFS